MLSSTSIASAGSTVGSGAEQVGTVKVPRPRAPPSKGRLPSRILAGRDLALAEHLLPAALQQGGEPGDERLVGILASETRAVPSSARPAARRPALVQREGGP